MYDGRTHIFPLKRQASNVPPLQQFDVKMKLLQSGPNERTNDGKKSTTFHRDFDIKSFSKSELFPAAEFFNHCHNLSLFLSLSDVFYFAFSLKCFVTLSFPLSLSLSPCLFILFSLSCASLSPLFECQGCLFISLSLFLSVTFFLCLSVPFFPSMFLYSRSSTFCGQSHKTLRS